MTDFKDKANAKIDDAANAARKATATVADKSRDIVHSAGKKLASGGKRLQKA